MKFNTKQKLLMVLVLVLTSTVLYGQYDGGDGSGYGSVESPGFPNEWALPVELTSFSAQVTGEGVLLEWETATEVDNYGFGIERNYEDQWTEVGFVEGAGNSYSPRYYQFLDPEKILGDVSYRLKQINTDGTFDYSSEIGVNLGIPISDGLEQNFPNPFNPTTNIRFSIESEAFVKLTIYNVIGEKIVTLVNEQKDAGVYNVAFNGEGLNSGIYFYKIEAGDFVQINKMMMVK